MEVPAFIAIYRSAKDFIGEDNFTLEVTGASGKFQLQRITVTVAAAGAGLIMCRFMASCCTTATVDRNLLVLHTFHIQGEQVI